MASFPGCAQHLAGTRETFHVCPINNQMNIIKRLLVRSIVTNTPRRQCLFEKYIPSIVFLPPRPTPQMLLWKDLRKSDVFANISPFRGHLALLGSHLECIHPPL